MTKKIGLVVVGSVSMFLLGASVDSRPTGDADELAASLQSADLPTRWAAAKQIHLERRRAIEALVAVVKNRASDDGFDLAARSWGPKKLALEMLGDLRADDQEVVRLLYDHLTYEVMVVEGGLDATISLSNRYPAAGALVRIGKPACEQAWDTLSRSSDPLRRQLAAHILERVESNELAEQLITDRLQKLEKLPKDSADRFPEKKNLQAAREQIRHARKGAGP